MNIIIDRINDCNNVQAEIRSCEKIPSSCIFSSYKTINVKKNEIKVQDIHNEPIIKKSDFIYNSLLNKYIETIQKGAVSVFINKVVSPFGIFVKSIIFQRVDWDICANY